MSSNLSMDAVSRTHCVVLARTLQALVIKHPLGVPTEPPDPGTAGRLQDNRGWQLRTQSLSRTSGVRTEARPPRGALCTCVETLLCICRAESCRGLQPQTWFRNDNHLKPGVGRLCATIRKHNATSRASHSRLMMETRDAVLGFSMCPASSYG